jgi:hypothetical protein
MEDRSLQVPHGLDGAPEGGGGIGVERVVLGLDGPTGAGEEARPAVGLGDDPPNRQPPDALQQVIGALGAEPVGGDEALVELAEVGEPRQRGQLVDHHLGLGLGEGVDHGVPVQRVEDHRGGAGGAQRLHLTGRAGGADHRVAACDQQGDEPPAQHPGRSRDEDPHGALLVLACEPDARQGCRPGRHPKVGTGVVTRVGNQLRRSSAGCGRWPRVARRSRPSGTAVCQARSCYGSPGNEEGPAGTARRALPFPLPPGGNPGNPRGCPGWTRPASGRAGGAGRGWRRRGTRPCGCSRSRHSGAGGCRPAARDSGRRRSPPPR